MRLRIIARLASAERDGSLYLACGCASLAGAVAVIVSPSHIPTSTERAMAAKLQAKNEALKATLRALKTPLSKDDLARLVEVAVAKAYEAEQEQRSSSIREGDLMAQAPLLPATAGILSQSVMLDPKPTVTELRDNGLCRIDACLTPGVAATLLAHVNTSLADARSRVAVDGKQRDQDTFYKALKEAQPPPKVAGLWPRLERLATSARTFATHTVAPEVELESFGAVLAPTERWDLKLLLTPPVVAALREVLGPLQAVCETMLGKDAVLFECAALVADPHAPRQPIHPDTAYQQPAAGPLILTVFVALQDVSESMGPTVFLPGTHCKESHEAFNAQPQSGVKQALLSSAPRRLGTLCSGDAMIFDSRLLHCGSANESESRRVLFYFSFRAADARVPQGTLDSGLELRQLQLGSTKEWL